MKKIFTKNMRNTWIAVAIAILAAVASLCIMPDIIPTHFGPSGEPDAWGSKYFILLYPGVLLLVNTLAEPMKKIDPKEKSYERFGKYYYTFFFGFTLFFLVTELANIAIALGANINVGNIICFTVGVLFVFFGNMMPKIKQNYFFGIKTPWSIADEENWYKTHRMAGKAFVAGGIVTMVLAFIPGEVKIWILFAVILVLSIGLYVYSAMLHIRKQNKK